MTESLSNVSRRGILVGAGAAGAALGAAAVQAKAPMLGPSSVPFRRVKLGGSR